MEYVVRKVRGGFTVQDRVDKHGADVALRLAGRFAAQGLAYPPREVAILAFKDIRRMEVYARDAASSPWIPVLTYPIRGMSGTLGPKLREGDRQVPEGLYSAESLNPNSLFHVSIRLNYPNAFDREKGAADGRTTLGSDIMIHGMEASIGCLAMGNEAAEDLFVLAALVGKENLRIVVAPTDFRRREPAKPIGGPAWLPDLHAKIRAALADFPAGA